MTDFGFSAHLTVLQERLAETLQIHNLEGVVISSGVPHSYFADDQEAVYHEVPHFAHWCPQPGPYHFLVVTPGVKPKLIRWSPSDYWEEHFRPTDAYWCASFDIVEVSNRRASWGELPGSGRWAYIGPECAMAQEWGLITDTAAIVSRMDWDRGIKTPYEIHCLREATRLGALGHRAAKAQFEAGASEMEIHLAYLAAAECLDGDLPYGSIVALNEKAAILHYQNKRTAVRNGAVLLLDSGAMYQGYGSDITRTYATAAAPAEFHHLLTGMAALQARSCDRVQAGVSFLELHHQAHLELGALLVEVGLLQDLSPEEAVKRGCTSTFLPHGLGHLLGIQVHDVGGLQKNPQGEPERSPTQYPRLRTVRALREGEVVTVEPGCYFIPVLLERAKQGRESVHLNWRLIDKLRPCGGIRIEDNVHVGAKGHDNLTRAFLP